jgi:hypothetical protein
MLQTYRSSRATAPSPELPGATFLVGWGELSVRDVLGGKHGHVVCGPDRHTVLAGR